jgi:DNA-binding PadR family transcriptional regulator
MPIHHAVLALLSDGPSYGYELKGEFEAAVGPQWGELNIGHLYQVLDRLERDGLAAKRPVPQADRPDKLVYRITAAGRREMEEWLQTPHRRAGYRDDFFLKLVAAARLGREPLQRLLRLQREAYLGELATLSRLRGGEVADEVVALLLEAARLETEAALRVVELALEREDLLLASARAHNATETTRSQSRRTRTA